MNATPLNSVYRSVNTISAIWFFGIVLFNIPQTLANDPFYEARRSAFVDTALTYFNRNAITLQAYRGLPVDQATLDQYLNELREGTTADFTVVQLIRVLCFAPGEYDQQILPVLDSIPFWITPNDTSIREYWSENHMLLWSSSEWLLHERFGRPVDSSLEVRLRHYLKLKIRYGFYEFFSSVYSPFTLAGLLNLADFAIDDEIRNDAIEASSILLKEILSLTNDQGVYYPIAGRNYHDKYQGPYGQGHSVLIWLLTGLGPMPVGTSIPGGIFASSALPVDDIIASWKPELDTSYFIGHTLTEGFSINNILNSRDKVLFQWSSGAYFHPDVAESTFRLIDEYNLWNQRQFEAFSPFSFLPPTLMPAFANIASPISKSSVLCGQKVSLFKNRSVTLSSVHDFWKGKLGYQAFTSMACVGTTSVYTASGNVTASWSERPALNANEHLPYVDQKKNVSLIMYRPEKGLALFGHKDLDVTLHWNTGDFEEVRYNGNWILGRQGTSYVAVRRHCTGQINGQLACDNPDGQTWVIVVGNEAIHGSFATFENIISQAQFEERWYFNLPTLQWVYYSKVNVDGQTLEYAWNGDLLSGPTQTPTAIPYNPSNNALVRVYPNPATNEINLEFPNDLSLTNLKICDMSGRIVYSRPDGNTGSGPLKVLTSGWAKGLYFISLEYGNKTYTQKVILQ